MNLLSESQFYITTRIQNSIKNNLSTFNSILDFVPNNIDMIPFLYFAYHTIEEFPLLEKKLQITQGYDEFTVNSYFYLIGQEKYYREEGINADVAIELAFEDLKSIFESYNDPL